MTSVFNPRNAHDAVAYALHLHAINSGGWNDLCDHFVGVAYGWAHTGEPTAAKHFADIPKAYHLNESVPQLGALGFWTGGQGHVAIADGHGTWISTDQPSPSNAGHIGIGITSAQIEKWGVKWAGACAPYFPHGVGPIGPDNHRFIFPPFSAHEKHLLHEYNKHGTPL